MAIQEKPSLLHWNYFLALESDVDRLSRFVEFSNKNFGAYSIEMAHLFLAAASEVDVVAKQFCAVLDSGAKAGDIEQYRAVLRRCLPELENSIVLIPRHGLELKPWSNWQEDKTPEWWRGHNKVKHERGQYFSLANLHNVLNAMAGLFLLTLYYYRNLNEGQGIQPPPSLFMPPPELAKVGAAYSGDVALFFTNWRGAQ